MFIPIKIDLDDLVEEFGLDGNQIRLLGNELINSISDKYFAAIKQKVNTTLQGTRGIYLKNLRIEQVDDFTKEIILSGWLPNAIESGVTTFDMKPGFMKAKNVRISAKGNWYTTIPFKWTSSKTDSANSEGSKRVMPNNVSLIAIKQKTPLKESQIPESQRLHQIKDLTKGINAVKVPGAQGIYQHKSSIYAGIQKIDKGAISFRRAGAVSNPNSFWHPGLVKYNFFEKGLQDISNELPILADKIIDEFLQGLE